ncbi:hypothetical protein ABPG75_003028 [Micractinium tetrahymenae]
MSKARSKKARTSTGGSDEVNGEEAAALKALLETGTGPLGGLTDAQVLRVLKADNPCEGLYSKACKSKAGNPNCLCNLIPAPGSFRRQGLWAKEADVVGTLGPDPAARARKDRGCPVGLKNLGNTCYVNSVLQCLFANRPFRRAVYAVRPPLADEPIVKELRELFMAMEHGCIDPVDPEPLARALQLDHAVQQDGQEFMKLFLSLLEARFEQQEDVKDVIQSLFRGQRGYSTTCRTCGRQSESSARSENFYEVDVPVKGHKSLTESLASMLFPEMLEGDNQYQCDFCGHKVDATRQLELRSLPPMLCFSLQRFVFDFHKMDRVKVSDKFAFPLSLDMAPVVGQHGRTDMVYDLEAIMVHKGSSAIAGHYVAHIQLDSPPAGSTDGKQEAAPAVKEGAKKGRSKKAAAAAADANAAADGGAADAAAAAAAGQAGGLSWWRFDDDSVTELKGGPTSSTDHGGAAGKAAAGEGGGGGKGGAAGGGAGKKGGRGGGAKGGRGGAKGGRGGKAGGRGRGVKRAAVEDSEDEEEQGPAAGEGMDVEQQEADDLQAAIAASMAQAQGEPAAGPAAAPAPAGGTAAPAAAADEIVSSNAYLLVYRQRGAELPMVPLAADQEAALASAAQQYAELQGAAAEAYATSKAQLLERQAARQAEVRAVVEAAVKLEEGDTGRFVSSEWLEKWAGSGVEAGPTDPIDNAPLLCPHGKLDPGQIKAARRVSTAAWEQLRELCRGGPELGPGDACPTCLVALLDTICAKEDTEEQYGRYQAVARLLDEGEGLEHGLAQDFLISHSWLKDFLKKRAPGTLPSKPPTAAITCPCGALAPESAKEAKRIAIPADFWRFLQRGWRAQCAEKAQKEKLRAQAAAAKRAGSAAAAGAAAAAAAFEAAEAAEGKEQDDAEVICLDGAEQQQQPKATAGRQPRRGRGGRGGSDEAPAAAVKREREEAAEEEDVAEVKAEGKAAEAEVVVLDSPRGEAAAAEAAAGEGSGAAGAAAAAADELRELPAGTPECPTCAGDLHAASKALKGLQGRLQEERQELAHLLQRQEQRLLQPGARYRMVPSAFMDAWRAYMGQAGKKTLGKGATAAAIVQPPSLAEAMEAVLCECHRGGSASGAGPEATDGEASAAAAASADAAAEPRLMLAFPPPAVANKRGRWVVDEAEGTAGAAGAAGAADAAGGGTEEAGHFELISEHDWAALSVFYGAAEQEGGRRKRQRGEGARPGRLGEQFDALLEQGIIAALVVERSTGGGSPGASSHPQQQPDVQQQDEQQQAVQQQGDGGEAPAANGAAAAQASGRARRGGRVAQLQAEAAGGGEASGSDGEYAPGRELTVGTSSNPYQLKRPKAGRTVAAGSGHLETDPPLCTQAVAARTAAAKAARLVYSQEEVLVELVASEGEALAAAGAAAAGAERKSKRARKGRAPIRVDSATPLETFKALVWEALGVHPLNAQLFLRGAPMTQDGSATLAECEVFPGDEVKVVDSGEHDSNDYSSILPYSGKGGRRQREAERGFAGTALTGQAPANGTGGGGGSADDGGSGVEGGEGAVAGGAAAEDQREEGGEGGPIDMDAELAAAAAAEEQGQLADMAD